MKKVIRKNIIIVILGLFLFPTILFSQWEQMNLSSKRAGVGVCSIGNKIFFAGGLKNSTPSSIVDIFNIEENTWEAAELSSGKSNVSCATINNKAFFIGGYDGGTMDIYNDENEEWSFVNIPKAKYGKIIANGENIYLANGNYLDIYNVENDTWETLTFSPKRNDFSLVSIKNKIIIAGGAYSGTTYKDVNIYNIDDKTWEIDSLSVPRKYLLGINSNNKVYFTAGEGASYNIINIIDVYDVDTKSWTIDSLPTKDRWDFAQTVHENKIYYAGGQVSDFINQFISDIDIFDTEKNSWSKIQMPTGRSQVGIIGVNNKLYIAGGKDEGAKETDLVEILTLEPSSVLVEENINFMIYPNPVISEIEIVSEINSMLNYEIYNVKGSLISNGILSNEKIDVSYLSIGNYVIKLKNDNSTLGSKQFVKL